MQMLERPKSEHLKGGLWYGVSGPLNADIVLVGESWGVEEEKASAPFVGSSGTELTRMLAEAGIQRDNILLTNVVAERPYGNEMWRFFHPKDSPSPSLLGGLDPRENVRSDIRRLYRQIGAYPRKLVIATGNYALWCLTGKHGIAKQRDSNGRPIPAELQPLAPNGIVNQRGSMWFVEPLKELVDDPALLEAIKRIPCLPIIHPAAIMREWSNRALTVHDLKARVPMALKGDWRQNPPPVILAPPTFEQAAARLRYWLSQADAGKEILLAEDIETVKQTIITCLGLADSRNFAMSIPFVRRTDGGLDSFFPLAQERTLFGLLRRVNSHPNIRIVGQNFIYDTQFIQLELGVTPRCFHDTMLAQNVVFPGTPKDLGYLSSLFCQYHWYWKDDSKDWDQKGTLEQLLQYNGMDNLRTWEIAEGQVSMIERLGLMDQMKFKMRINSWCLKTMNRGVRFDVKEKARMAAAMSDAYNDLARELLIICPQKVFDPDYETNVTKGYYTPKNGKRPKMTMWYRSEKQIKWLFYDQLGFHVVKNRKTGKPTSGKEARNELIKKHPEFTGLFRRLELAESVENTAGVISSGLDPDGRMRSSFNPGGTETHRLSSSTNAFGRGTNLQNLTKGKEDENDD